jgi:PPM family protein phosphatase
MTRAVDAAGAQIQGMRRRQEDAWAIEHVADGEVLALVADGLGGHPCGDIASREATDAFVRAFLERRAKGTEAPRRWMQESAFAADERLREMQAQSAEMQGMATTLVALYLRPGQFWAATVGDSYLLLAREGQLVRLNELHAEEGGVTSCLGFHLTRIDLADGLAVGAGDRFLLATDGMATLAEEEVAAMLAGGEDASDVTRQLLAAVEAAEHPGQDNVTVVAVIP